MRERIKMRVKNADYIKKQSAKGETAEHLLQNAGKIIEGVKGEHHLLFDVTQHCSGSYPFHYFQHPYHNLKEALKAGKSMKMRVEAELSEEVQRAILESGIRYNVSNECGKNPVTTIYISLDENAGNDIIIGDDTKEYYAESHHPEWDPVNDCWKDQNPENPKLSFYYYFFGRNKNYVKKDDIIEALKEEYNSFCQYNENNDFCTECGGVMSYGECRWTGCPSNTDTTQCGIKYDIREAAPCFTCGECNGD